MTILDILDKWKHIIAERFDSMFGEYDSMYDLCYPEQQQHPAPYNTLISDSNREIDLAWITEYLQYIKPFCRISAEVQQYDDDFQDFSNAIDNFKLENNATNFISKNKKTFEILKQN